MIASETCLVVNEDMLLPGFSGFLLLVTEAAIESTNTGQYL